MRNHFSAIAAAILLACVSFACTADQVAPQSDNSSNLIENGAMGDNGPHYTLSPICSNVDVLVLASATGSFTVPNSSNSWGKMEICNGMDVSNKNMLETKFSLAYNWYIDEVTTYIGDASLLAIGPNGVPIIDSSWTIEPVAPVLNNVSLYHDLSTLPAQNTLLARVRVGQMDWNAFDGSLDASTVQYLWVWNDQFMNVGSPREAASPLHLPWETVACSSLSEEEAELQF